MMRRRFTLCALIAAVPACAAWAQTPEYVSRSPLLPIIRSMPQAGWARVNLNAFQDVFPPDPARVPYWGWYPDKIMAAWSSFAWDSNRGDLILYGGGHGNYSGNEVYRWRSSTLRWERASLPSQVKALPGTIVYVPVDGPDAAPPSAHTYDNSIFLPVFDRFLTFGGAAFNNGGNYVKPSETNPGAVRSTGPYLFDPSRADGTKVGGTTGSGVEAGTVGGQMWSNRDINKHLAGRPKPGWYVNGCTAYARENGHDVVYIGAPEGSSTQPTLYRYELVDLAHPTLDRIDKVGIYWNGTSGQTTCAHDPQKKLFVRTGINRLPFVFWDLNVPGLTNADRLVDVSGSIATFSAWLSANGVNILNCALDFDPVRSRFLVWCGKGPVWALTSPAANVVYGWSIQQLPSSTAAVPPGDIGTGILGKWKYIPYFDVFIGVMGQYSGSVWVYKPAGWRDPGGSPSPVPGQNVSVTLQNGVAGYQGTADVSLYYYHPTINYGSTTTLSVDWSFSSLIRFAILSTQGGPVPAGAVIRSAQLDIYKEYYDHVYRLHSMLKPWDENQASWQSSRQGVPWALAGARGKGSDYAGTHDAEVSTGWNPGWMTFDVTARVASYASGASNFGWRLIGVSGNPNLKHFRSSESTADPARRPRLRITYTPPATQ